MENLIEQLEVWRQDQGLSKADTADSLGVSAQAYSHWVTKGQLPGKHTPTVKRLVQGNLETAHFNSMVDKLGEEQISDVIVPIISKVLNTLFEQIGRDVQLTVMRHFISELPPKDRMALAHFCTEDTS